MHSIGIESAQNVVIQHEVASLGDRIVAYIIDMLVILAWIVVMAVLIFVSIDALEFGAVTVTLIVIAVVPYMFYHLVCEITMDGQSIGKRAQRIKVARLDGGQPTLGQYVMRWVLRPIDGFYWLGLVVILINGKGQRLGDLAAGTTVVSLKQRLRVQDTLMTDVAAEHQVSFPEAVRLSDAQAALIKEVISNTQVNDRWTLVEEMAAKVRAAIGNEGQGLKALEFLQAVLRDYVHLTGQAGKGPIN